MAVTIDNDLLTFEEKMSGGLDGVSSMITTLTSKLDEAKSVSKTAVTELNAVYTGEGLSTAIGSFASIEAAVDGIKASIPEGPEQAVSMARDLLTKIKDLRDLKDKIDALEKELSELEPTWAVEGDDDKKKAARAHNQQIANKKDEIEEEEEKFKTQHEEAKSKLSAIKAINPTIDIQVKVQEAETPVSEGEVVASLQGLKEGTYNLVDYTGKNGRKIRTYIFVPEGASTTTGLPVGLSMGGDGAKATNGGALTAGVGQQLREGRKFSGIIVVLEAEDDSSYSDGRYLDTAKELADNVVTTYKADPKRISINGYSYGVFGATHMLERFPNYFSQAVLLADGNGAVGKETGSKEQGYKNIATTPVHIICGTGDTSRYPSARRYYEDLLKYGCQATFESRNGDHWINTFYPIKVNGKEYANYQEFCLAQSRA